MYLFSEEYHTSKQFFVERNITDILSFVNLLIGYFKHEKNLKYTSNFAYKGIVFNKPISDVVSKRVKSRCNLK